MLDPFVAGARGEPATLEEPWPRPAATSMVSRGHLLLLLLAPLHLLIVSVLPDFAPLRLWKELLVGGIVLSHLTTIRSPHKFGTSTLFGHWSVAAFVLATCARGFGSVVSGGDLGLTALGAYNLLLYVPLVGVVWTRLSDADRADGFLWTLMLIGGVIGALAVLDWTFELARQIEVIDARGLTTTVYVGSGYRAYLGSDNPMELGIYLGTAVLVAQYWLMRRTIRAGGASLGGQRLSATLCLVTASAGLLATFSRGPLLATLVGVVFLLAFGRTGVRLQALFAAPVKLVVAVLIMVPATVAFLSFSSQGLSLFVSSVRDWSSDPANVIRALRWREAVGRIVESPLVGDGLGAASTRFQPYRYEVLGQGYFQAESGILMLASEGGLLLLGAFILVIGIAVKRTVQISAADDAVEDRALPVMIAAVILCLFVEFAINPMLDFRSFVILQWTFIGLALRSNTLARRPIVGGKRPVSNPTAVTNAS